MILFDLKARIERIDIRKAIFSEIRLDLNSHRISRAISKMSWVIQAEAYSDGRFVWSENSQDKSSYLQDESSHPSGGKVGQYIQLLLSNKNLKDTSNFFKMTIPIPSICLIQDFPI